MALIDAVVETKRCARCQTVKPVTEFYTSRDRGTPVGYCKPCGKEAHSEWLAANAAHSREYSRRRALRKYGITLEEYMVILESQGGRCAICREAERGASHQELLHVDHDHATGAVRGLLCFSCNRAIGYLKDSPERLRAAARYLDAING